MLWHLKQSNRSNKTMFIYETHLGLILLGLIAFSFLLGLLFFSPKYGLFLVIFSRPILDNINVLRTYMLPGIDMNVLQMIGVAVPCSMVFICLIKKFDFASNSVNFFRHSFLNTYFLFLLFCLPSLAIADKTFLAMGGWFRLFTLWAVIIYADFALESRRDVIALLTVFVLSSIYPLGRLLIDLFTGTRIEIGGYTRLTGGYFHMSILSIMLMSFLPAYLYFFHRKAQLNNTFIQAVQKSILAVGILLILLFIYLTNYRTALLSVITLLFVFLLFRKKFMWATLLVSATVIGLLFVPTLKDRFMPLMIVLPKLYLLFDPQTSAYDHFLSGRFGIWRKIITTFLYQSDLPSFVFGFGYDPLIRAIKTFGHNDFLYFMFHYGLLSLVLFCTFIFKIVKLSLRYSTDFIPQIVSSLLIAFIVSSMSHPTFLDVRNLLFLGGYIAVLIKYIETIPGEKTTAKNFT